MELLDISKQSNTAVTIGISLLVIVATAVLLKLRQDRVNKILAPMCTCTFSDFLESFVTGQVHRLHLHMCRTVGPVYRLPVMTWHSIFIVHDPALARIIMEGDAAHGIPEAEKSMRYKQLAKLTNGVDTMLTKHTHGEGWEATRKAVAPSFSVTNLTKALPELQVKLKQFEDILDAHIASDKPLIDLPEWMIRVTIDFLATSMFRADYHTLQNHSLNRGIPQEGLVEGIQGADLGGEGGESDGQIFVKSLLMMTTEFVLKGALRPFRQYRFWDAEVMRDVAGAHKASQDIENIAKKVLASYRSRFTEEELEDDKSILAHLIRSPYPSEKERVADVTTFMMAGHDTTAYQLSWIVIELSRHPFVLSKLRTELDSLAPKGEKTVFTPQNLSKLTYLGYIIKEGMRLWPVAAVGTSRVAPCDIPYKDTVIKKGSIVGVGFFAMFRNGINKPDEFIPDRWLESDEDAVRLKDISFPFSIGKRACVGQTLALLELKLVLATLFYSYDFQGISEVSEMYYITLKPTNANFKITKRVI